jgi:hypothetical protein
MKKNKSTILLMIGLLIVLIAGTTVTIQANTSSQVVTADATQVECSVEDCPPGEPCESMENCDGEIMHCVEGAECSSSDKPGC